MNKNNKELMEKLLHTFQQNDIDIKDIIEILGNLMVQIGFANISNNGNTVESIANDVKSNGETLYNALARQGILMLTWMKSEEKNV